MDDLELEIKHMIVSVLKLEGLEPSSINSADPLFGDGLGLDSIDALELGVALRKKYGVTFDKADENVKRHFFNVQNLASFVHSQRQGASDAVVAR